MGRHSTYPLLKPPPHTNCVVIKNHANPSVDLLRQKEARKAAAKKEEAEERRKRRERKRKLKEKALDRALERRSW